jgi:hypothetical protein
MSAPRVLRRARRWRRERRRAAARIAAGGLVPQLRAECEAMARYALQQGMAAAPELVARLAILLQANAALDESQLRELAGIHRRLAFVIAPARPQAVLLLESERRCRRGLTWLGPIPLIRGLTVTAMFFLLAVVGTALSEQVSSENIEQGFLDSDGATLLWNALFLLFCAGLGASFSALFLAHRYVSNATYDPKFDASYGARMILGLIAGLILVEMLPQHLFDQGSMHAFGKPALAMLGGFSATVVYRMLQRLFDALETLVHGDASVQAQASIEAHRAQTASEHSRWQCDVAARLMGLQQSIEAGASVESIQRRLAEFTRGMLAADTPPLHDPTADE